MKKTGRLGIFAAALLVGIALFSGCGNKKSDTENSIAPQEAGALSGKISTNGSTSMEKVVGALSEAFMARESGVSITYDPTGSGSGITSVTEGSTDIGLSSRSLKDSETGLDATVIALDGIAIIAHNGNPVQNLTLEQIAGLATGEIGNWQEVGGADKPVVLIGREANSGTRDGFESIVGVAEKCAYQQELTSTGAVIAAVASNENAVGYASLASVGDKVKVVSVNGIAPSEEAVLDGSYPVQRPFMFVTRSGEAPSPQVQAFIDFARSEEAGEIIANAGAVQPK